MFSSRVLFKDSNVRESTMHVLVVYSYFVLEMFEEFRRKEMSGVRGGSQAGGLLASKREAACCSVQPLRRIISLGT